MEMKNAQVDRIAKKAGRLLDLKIKRAIRETMPTAPAAQTPVDPAKPSTGVSVSSPKLPAIGSRVLPAWIPANYALPRGKKHLADCIDACAAAGCSFGFECAAWEKTAIFFDSVRFKMALESIEFCARRCRERGIYFIPSMLNNNSHIRKYGALTPYKFSTVWPQALQLLDLFKRIGPAGMLIQPCAETQTADGVKWEKECAKQLRGFDLIYNGKGGRPSKPEYGWKYFSNHPTKTTAKVPRGCLAISDCGSIILQLHSGYNGPAKPSLQSWAAAMKKAGALLVGDYAFEYAGKPDVQALRYLVAGLK